MSVQEAVRRLAVDPAVADEALVGRVRGGDPTAFEVLMRRHNQRVYRAVRSVLRSEADAEDAVQQTWLAAYAHLSQFKGDARFSTWLVRIALNEALMRARRRGRLVPVPDDGSVEPADASPAAEPEGRVMARELAGAVEAVVDALPEIHRTVFVLREIDGLDTAEVAQALGISEDAVKTRLHRARALVRAGVEARLGLAMAEAFPFAGWRCDRVVAAVLARLAGGKP